MKTCKTKAINFHSNEADICKVMNNFQKEFINNTNHKNLNTTFIFIGPFR